MIADNQNIKSKSRRSKEKNGEGKIVRKPQPWKELWFLEKQKSEHLLLLLLLLLFNDNKIVWCRFI